MNRDLLQRLIDAWDSSPLPKSNDGMMQERMEDLRAELAVGDKPASDPVAWMGFGCISGAPFAQLGAKPGSDDCAPWTPLYTSPALPPGWVAVRDERASHERYGMLRDWLVRHGLLHALFCQPEAGMPAGDFWILRKPYMVSGDGCEGYGKTEDEAIDDALDTILARIKD